MTFNRILILFSLLTLTLGSCTTITSTNVPGKKENRFPKKMIGDFEVVFPEDFAGLMEGEDAKMYVSFKADEMTLNNSDGETTTHLGDSLYISTIGKNYYLSLGENPSISIFKVVMKGKNVLLYPMYAREGVTISELTPYFTSVEEIVSEETEEESTGVTSFSVTIDDSKLENYFKSDLPLKDPYKLIRKKK